MPPRLVSPPPLPLGRVLMVQGTSSHAGKSTLVAALCRILAQEGFSVAPFKAQNMSLNSAVTMDGAEIGRAQMLQAQAAHVSATADMNPVLLKPQGDSTSQIVVRGRVHSVRHVKDYYEMRQQLWPVVTTALERLRAAHDVVVIEGAGSPAEINLRDRDIANMSVALHARAPVVLVGDIERGGVFASLVGTMSLLSEDERALVRGFVINKFRGDISLIDPGPAMLQQRTGVPTLGVIPYMFDVHLPEEDSLGIHSENAQRLDQQEVVDVAVLQFPHIANFDDFDPLRGDPRVNVRYVGSLQSFGEPDLIILPGSKTTTTDLTWLKSTGLADAIVQQRHSGIPVIAICGGFQMLGTRIHDPEAVEANVMSIPGLGLLKMETVFETTKTTHQARGTVQTSAGILQRCQGMEIAGYEIHMGATKRQEGDTPFHIHERSGHPVSIVDGAVDEDGWTLGTYLHGLFHNSGVRNAILENVAVRARKTISSSADTYDLDTELDKLAATVRSHLDLPYIYNMLNV